MDKRTPFVIADELDYAEDKFPTLSASRVYGGMAPFPNIPTDRYAVARKDGLVYRVTNGDGSGYNRKNGVQLNTKSMQEEPSNEK